MLSAGTAHAPSGSCAGRVHDMNRWNDLVALAREIEAALTEGVPIEPDKARRLARMVLAVPQPPVGTSGRATAGLRGPAPK
jgi:hypothetical protein